MRHFTLAFLLSAAAVGAARAGRPLQADDAPVMEPRACEIEGASSDWRGGGHDQHQSRLQIGCGIGWGTELNLQALRPRELKLGRTRARLATAGFSLAF